MPTIKQLPAATAVSGTDLLPLSQNGLTRSVAVSTLLANTQPLLSVPQSSLLGRVSSGPGSPESIAVGTGLTLQAGTVAANGADHVGFSLATSLLSGDEVVVNSGATPRRLPATQLRSLFAAGTGIQIDSSGVISATSVSGSGGSTSTGPAGPAGQGFTFRGAWQANVAYNAYDVVTFGGQTYLAATAITAAAAFSAAAWSLMAAAGAAGQAGATGAIGATGATGPAGPTVAATTTSVGAIKPGTGLTVTSDGTLSIANVSLGSLAQGGAAVGQLLGWSGVGWSPTTPSAGTSYTGVSPISVSSGTISLAQSGAATGQVLTWNGTAWVPQQAAAAGASVGTAIPLANGVASAGTVATASREDHRHPTDTSRAPVASPVFTGSITLPIWTTTSRPAAPTIGMEGFASDTGRRETYTSAGWVQSARTADVPAAAGQLLGGASSVGGAVPVSVGSGLSLSGGTLSATPQATSSVSGVSLDGNTNAASAASPYQMATSDRVVDVNKTNGAPTKILLPTSPTLWVEYTIIDGKGDASTNNIVVAAASGTTINGQSTFLMNANNDAITLRAISASVWRIV